MAVWALESHEVALQYQGDSGQVCRVDGPVLGDSRAAGIWYMFALRLSFRSSAFETATKSRPLVVHVRFLVSMSGEEVVDGNGLKVLHSSALADLEKVEQERERDQGTTASKQIQWKPRKLRLTGDVDHRKLRFGESGCVHQGARRWAQLCLQPLTLDVLSKIDSLVGSAQLIMIPPSASQG